MTRVYRHYGNLRWFRRTIALGFIVNAVFVVLGLFAPETLQSLIAVGHTNTVHWLQNVALLLGIVTLMYVPVYRDAFRYLFISFLAVGGRFAAGSLFVLGVWFMGYPDGMLVLGCVDLALSTLQAVLLFRLLRDGDPKSH